jgi:hypothetical protein
MGFIVGNWNRIMLWVIQRRFPKRAKYLAFKGMATIAG